LALRRPRAPIQLIAGDWMTDEGQMDPNLVRASGLDRDLEQRAVPKSLDNAKMRHRWPPGPHHGHALSVLRVAANRRVDRGLFIPN
jgi:hypothetical protein